MAMPSFQHGVLGSLTSRTVVPTRHRSPTTDRLRSIPATVRFSPNDVGGTGRPSWPAHQS